MGKKKAQTYKGIRRGNRFTLTDTIDSVKASETVKVVKLDYEVCRLS